VELDALARQLGVSFESFRKGFRAATGKSPARYRSEKRVEAAAQLLASSCLSSKEIAQRLGFADECHFSKRFKQLTGVAPRDFRRRVCGHADKANAAVAQASGLRAQCTG
jgi:transcriptional regulator GlxA family with amidase domain